MKKKRKKKIWRKKFNRLSTKKSKKIKLMSNRKKMQKLFCKKMRKIRQVTKKNRKKKKLRVQRKKRLTLNRRPKDILQITNDSNPNILLLKSQLWWKSQILMRERQRKLMKINRAIQSLLISKTNRLQMQSKNPLKSQLKHSTFSTKYASSKSTLRSKIRSQASNLTQRVPESTVLQIN